MKPSTNPFKRVFTCIALFFLMTAHSHAQSISGYVLSESNDPVPFANIFIKEMESGVAADNKGHFFLTINPGIYNLIVSSVGYHSKTFQIVIRDKPVAINFTLQSSSVELNEVLVKVRRRDPAYEIIQHVIENKEKYLTQVKSSRSNVYMRAMETADVTKKKKEEENDEELEKPGPPEDPFEAERKKEEARLQKINLVEMQLVLNYQYPDHYKEERTAYKMYGRKDGLFLPVFSQVDFNFYRNLVDMKGISEIPLISPVSRTAVLSYKYKLEETLREGSDVVYKIRVTPRKTGDATCRGYLYINEGTWNINRLELSMHKGGLKFYDEFTIKQTYKEIDSALWIPFRQEFDYETKAGRKLFKGNTVIIFSDYQRDHVFPHKFFGDEVAVTTKEAYKRDSAYWNATRPEELTPDQKKVISYRDSIEAVRTSKHFLDSLEARYNKVTVGEVIFHGVSFRSEEKKMNVMFPSLANLVNFEVVGGFRLGPYVRYFKKFDNEKMLWTSASFTIGLKNADWQGGFNVWTLYNPHRQGSVSARVGRSFYSVNSFDAYLNQLRISNFILHEHVNLFHRNELLNGLYVSTEASFHNRKSIDRYDATSVLNTVIEEDDPLVFEDYQALISEIRLSYTPRQQFMTEPNRKVILGSKYPTFSITHRKGWHNLLTSDIDFDYLEGSIEQNLMLGTLGNSRYTLTAGKFINTKDLRYVDLKRFRQSDPYLYSNPMHSFQLLDTALTATDLFLEAHYIHHFNGAMINNIPLIKKLKLRTVAGAGAMWIKENNYRHEEIFGGVERVFKLGARRRLRLGVYGVVSQSNYSPPKTDFKISFDIIDTWRREWSY